MRNEEFAHIGTGEILTGQQILIETLQEQQEAHNRKVAGLNKRKSKESFNVAVNEHLGSFNFSHYKEVLELMKTDKGEFDGALAFRFIYLSTFMDFENNLRWGQSFRDKDRGYMREKDLGEVLGISRPHVIKFKQRLIELNIITIDSQIGRMNINIRFCHKGKIKNSLKGQSVRVFEDGIQNIYRNSRPVEHSRLGIFIQLLPFLSTQHNVLCINVEEERAGNIVPLSIQDICTIVGHNVKNARRLENELIKTTVGQEPVMMKHRHNFADVYSINPKVFYKGNDIESLQALINLFSIKM
ncbi:hypothetical protein AAGC94_06975 [Clostridium sporogenes]|uniref:hypothetical protein n=1 Tax=Clostridium sporogenes TaxID=1509 RepID=UPI00313AB2AE